MTGIPDGRTEGLRTAVQTLAEAKLEKLTANEVAAIAALHDEQSLTSLVLALSEAHTARAARTVLEAAACAAHRT